MKFSVVLPNCMQVTAVSQPWEQALSGPQIAQVARLADELGYETAFVSEHFFFPTHHVHLSGEQCLHATTALAFIAGATQRIKIASLVSILPLHNPIIAAKAWATLDWMSEGRAIAGIGVGWLREEFDAIGVPFTERGRRTDEYIRAMLELWGNPTPQFHGEFTEFADIAFAPRPFNRPRVPFWFGGDSRPALARTARHGDGWAPLQTVPEKLPARLDYLRSHPDWSERPFEVFFSDAWTNLGSAHAVLDNPLAVGSTNADRVLARLAHLSALGVTQTWVAPPPLPGLEAYLDHLRWVAEEIMPHA
jgi:probable F420-dependent oxidoreductase